MFNIKILTLILCNIHKWGNMDLTSIDRAIGNTPLAEITCTFNGELKKIYAKLEWYNLTGSIKDRIAYHILKKSLTAGKYKFGQPIVEVTSGNTGISFSAIGNLLGSEVIILMPEWLSQERKNLIKSYGAKLNLISKQEGGFLKGLELANSFKGAFLPLQFENEYNVEAHYLTTGKEMLETIVANNIKVNNFVAGVGTGGTLIGSAKRLKENLKKIKIVAVEPKSSPTLKTGKKVGVHKIEGISDEFVPKIYQNQMVDKICDVSDEDAVYFARLLNSKLGLGVGISSGANFVACLKQKGNSITVFSDDNKKYLSTYLMSAEGLKTSYNVNLLDLKIY